MLNAETILSDDRKPIVQNNMNASEQKAMPMIAF